MTTSESWFAPFERHTHEWMRRLHRRRVSYSHTVRGVVIEIEVPSKEALEQDALDKGMPVDPVLVMVSWPTLPPKKCSYRFMTERDAVDWAKQQAERINVGEGVEAAPR